MQKQRKPLSVRVKSANGCMSTGACLCAAFLLLYFFARPRPAQTGTLCLRSGCFGAVKRCSMARNELYGETLKFGFSFWGVCAKINVDSYKKE